MKFFGFTVVKKEEKYRYKRLVFVNKNNKLFYYIRNIYRQLLPKSIFRSQLCKKLETVTDDERDYINQRVNYYNKLDKNTTLPEDSIRLGNIKLPKKNRVYFFDIMEHLRYFKKNLKVKMEYGDIIEIPKVPSLLKSRPIDGDNSNSVVLKLNKIRHFIFVSDHKELHEKMNMVVWRGKASVKKPDRIRFLKSWYDNKLGNVGCVKNIPNYPKEWTKERMTMKEQLDYKFILCLEGHDVASNLKWVMSSNSIAVMPKPKYETWFMEGKLIANHHYILIKDDFSDLEEKIKYYTENINEATEIARNANEYVNQFRNMRQENLISLLVLQKYFNKTGQEI